VATVAAKILEAHIAEAQHGANPTTLALWEEAVKLEDRLAYSDPADWFYPVRHFFGAALLRAGKAAAAESVYREDLRRNPRNGWALFGLAQALKAQKRDAATVEREFATVWQRADVKIGGSIL
jgi:tetratricopeptide (TPR) repeat protein